MIALLEIARRFWRADRGRFAAGIAACAITVLSGMALLGLAGWFITASALAGLAGLGLSFNFLAPSAGIRFLALARTASRYAERLVTHDASLRFLAVLRVDLFRGFSALDGFALSRWRRAEMLQRVTGDVDALDGIYLRLILPAATVAVLAMVLTPALMSVGWGETLLAAGMLAGGLATALAAAVCSMRDTRRKALATEALRVRCVDLVRVQADLTFAGRLTAQRQAAMSAARRIAEASRRLDRLDQVAIATLSLLGAAGVIAMFLLAAAQLRAGRIDGPMVVLLVLGTLAVMEVLSPLRRGALEFGRTTLAARRLLPFLRLHPETHGASTGFERISSKQAPILSLYDVEYRYGEGRAPVLARFSLTVAPGERIALQGMSGSGKSTLLAMIARPCRANSRLHPDGRPDVAVNSQHGARLQHRLPDPADRTLWRYDRREPSRGCCRGDRKRALVSARRRRTR